MTTLLIAVCCLLIVAALAARFAASAESKRAGLPAGDVLYSDTGFAVGRVAPVTIDAEGVKQERPLVSKSFNLVGRPDYLIKTAAGVVPVEAKSTRIPAGGRPYDSHLMQLAAYCLLVEDVLGERVPYGVVRYRDGEVRVEYTDELRAAVIALVAEVREATGAEEVHRSHEDPRRCAGCSVREACAESLV